MFPYKEDLVRFDFEVAPEDESMWDFMPIAGMNGQNETNGTNGSNGLDCKKY